MPPVFDAPTGRPPASAAQTPLSPAPGALPDGEPLRRRATLTRPDQHLSLPRVAAAIVTHNKLASVTALVARLCELDVPAFVTANACTDGTAESLRRTHPSVSVLESRDNLGGTGGFNCSILAALTTGADYIFLLDDDALPDPDCVSRLVRFLDGSPDYVLAAPAVYLSDRPDVLQETGGDVRFDRDSPVQAWNRFRSRPALPPVIDIGYASACALLVRAEAILRAGVMDWSYFIFSDDVDWCLRLTRALGKAACVTGARALHDFPWAKSFSPQRLYYFHRNNLRLIARWHAGDPLFISVRRSLLRLFRSYLMARACGDAEIALTLRRAFSDAWRGRFGAWTSPVTFPASGAALSREELRRLAPARILINLRIETFLPALRESLGPLLPPNCVLDAVCDPHRVDDFRALGLFERVYARRPGRAAALRRFCALRRSRYDWVVTDAFLEPRGPDDMAGRLSLLYHEGRFWRAPHRPWPALAAAALSHSCAAVLANLLWWKFVWPQPEGAPPAEAGPLLKRIGIDPAVGQPWARQTDAVPVPPLDLAPFYGSRWLRLLRSRIVRPVRLPLRTARQTPAQPVDLPAFRGAETEGGYDQWCDLQAHLVRDPPFAAPFQKRPLFSVLVPVFNAPASWLRECIDSVRAQTDAPWELILCDDASQRADTRLSLDTAQNLDPRIRVLRHAANKGISCATNTAARAARGTYLVFIDQDDRLHPAALAAFATAIRAARRRGVVPGIIYADEDRFDSEYRRLWPGFKPGVSPDRLLATNYIHHPLVLRRGLFEAVGGLRSAFDGSQDHDLLLRAVEHAEPILHVPGVLYHMRLHPLSLSSHPEAKPEAHSRDARAIRETLVRRGIPGAVCALPRVPGFHVIVRPSSTASVSVLVPGCPPLSAAARAQWNADEFIVGDPAQSVPRQLNRLAADASGEVLVFASPALTPDDGWRRILIPHTLRQDIGLVTGTLAYADHRLFACGLVLGLAGGVGRWHCGCSIADPGYGGWMLLEHEVSAVPWQWMVVRRSTFIEAGGFDEGFRERGFDADLALRLSSREVRHLAVPSAVAVFTEPWPGPGAQPWDPADLARLWGKWATVLRSGDPCFNPNLSLRDEGIAMMGAPEHDLRRRGFFTVYDEATVRMLLRSLDPALFRFHGNNAG